MSYHPSQSDPPDPPPSSFPFPASSPSFWTEAIQAAPASPSQSKRHLSQSPPPQDDIRQVEAPLPERSRQKSPSTTLTYLPNRLDPFLDDDPHSYLANPEYAPNRFGDIGDYMRKKEIKVQTQNRDIALASAAEGIPQIFAGQSFWINGNTHPPMEELRKMILQRGGEVRPKLYNKGYVKFIIAPMLTQSKFKEFERYRVVKEGWITESCKEGKLLNWTRWKLQPQGGWEETGRKGLQGFLAGKGSQPPDSSGVKAEDDALEVDNHSNTHQDMIKEDESNAMIAPEPIRLSASTQSLLRPVTASQRPAATTPLPTMIKVETPPKSPVPPSIPIPAAKGSLLRSAQPSPIPFSPGVTRAESPMKEVLPAKVQRPEGGWWENYYTKDSNEDAARLLKNQEWRLKNTAERGNEGGFIDGYYQNSRLHHLSTWKAELKVLVAAAQQQSEEQSQTKPSSTLPLYTLSNATLPRAAQSTAAPGERVIFHVDFDCFFVSCGLATRPHLKGKPTVVCHSQVGRSAASTSEIASASYEARAKGVKNGMSLGRARTLVGDDLQTIPYEFETYKKFSLSFYTVLMGYADELQAVSVDEALIDVTSAVAARALAPEEANEAGEEENQEDGDLSERVKVIRDPAVEVAAKIRDEVRALTDGCEVSIGIAHNVLLAKLGTRRAKPAGVFHVQPEAAPGLLAPLDVEDLPSIGYSIRGKIEEKFGSTTCGDLLEQPKGAFRALLGPKTGDMVYGYLRGIDDRKLEPHKERKSISAEMNYGIRFQTQDQADTCIADLAAEVSKRMKQVNARGKLLTLKLMSRHPDAPLEPPKFLGHGWCETFNKSSPIGNKGGSATDNSEILAAEAVKLLRAMKLDPKELRGVGIQITKLDSEKPAERETGQATLTFGAKRKRSGSVTQQAKTEEASRDTTPLTVVDAQLYEKPRTPVSDTSTREEIVQKPLRTPPAISEPSKRPAQLPSPPLTRQRSAQMEIEIEAGPSRIPASSDGIDPEFLAALPPELRQEVKQDYALAKTRTRSVHATKQASVERQTSVSPPAKAKGQHAAAHITRQLRPKLKTQMKASAVADLPLYGAWAKANDREDAIDLTTEEAHESIGIYQVAELRTLGIDPTVFAELPEDMRKEIVDEERRKQYQKRILHRPADTSRLRARHGDSTRTASLSPSKTSRAGSAPPYTRPLAAVSRPPKPALLKATALPDVLETVTRWIDSRKGGPPAAKDAGKVKTYLVKCLDPQMGVGGLGIAIEVLQWMRMEIVDRWGFDGDNGAEQNGREWWMTWHEFKVAVDELAVQRLGAPLEL